jgi:ribosomal protein S12 methylthiotransferase accessory factor YcaO
MAEDGTTGNGLTTHAARNQASWDALSDGYQERHGGFLAASGGLAWGTAQIPEAELHVLGEIVGRDAGRLNGRSRSRSAAPAPSVSIFRSASSSTPGD